MKNILLIIFILMLQKFTAEAKVDAFFIKFYDTFVQVMSPEVKKKEVPLVLENKTMSKIVGELKGSKGTVFNRIAIPAHGFLSIQIDNQKNEQVFFIPLSPPAQSIELIWGQKTYEIPPRKK